MKKIVWLIAIATVSFGFYGFLFAEPKLLPSPTEPVRLPLIQDKKPLWSPDGKKIAFLRSEKGDRSNEIYVVDADGSNLQKFPKPKDSIGIYPYFSWSPDGKKIAFVSMAFFPGGCAFNIYIINADGTNLRSLTNGKHSCYPFCWSPDGKRIAFVKHGRGCREVWIIDANGKFWYKLVAGRDPAWSPDSKQIVFSDGSLYIIDIDGKNRRNFRRTSNAENIHWWGSSLSPNRRKRVLELEDGDIWKVDANKISSPRRSYTYSYTKKYGYNLTKTKDSQENEPCWSPNGKQIVYVRDYEIWVMNSNGSKQTQLTFKRTEAIAEAKKKQVEEKLVLKRALKESL